MIVSCPHCRGAFDTVPGYDVLCCPHCTREVRVADLVPAPMAVVEADPRSSSPSLASGGSSGGNFAPKLPKATKGLVIGCFHSRVCGFWGASDLYRTYVTSDELIFIHLGIRHLDENQEANQRNAAMGGGALPALFTSVLMHKKRMYYWNLIKALEKASVARLVEFASEDPNSFVLQYEDITAPRFERPSTFGFLSGTAYKALFKLHHNPRGKMAFQIPEIRDLRVALPTMQAQFADQLAVGFSWRDI